jgi:hypothetical protein
VLITRASSFAHSGGRVLVGQTSQTVRSVEDSLVMIPPVPGHVNVHGITRTHACIPPRAYPGMKCACQDPRQIRGAHGTIRTSVRPPVRSPVRPSSPANMQWQVVDGDVYQGFGREVSADQLGGMQRPPGSSRVNVEGFASFSNVMTVAS